MKFYESNYDDYLSSLKIYNMHPELEPVFAKFPSTLNELTNLIFYGPPGVGKYTQALNFIQKYSPSGLTYDKKINIQTEKYEYVFHISDIHYEVDMALLGCYSKLIWHDIIQQIVDIVSVSSQQKNTAIVVCKNFHAIHTELLDIFYSYMQEYNSRFSMVQLKFIIITEHLCFIPNNIISSCELVSIRRPNKEVYVELIKTMQSKKSRSWVIDDEFIGKIANMRQSGYDKHAEARLNDIDVDCIFNLKELRCLSKLETLDKIPNDIFNIVCNTIIVHMLSPMQNFSFIGFRDAIYDIFVYNLDVVECLWFIFSNLVEHNHLHGSAISDVLTRSYTFLKYYNNNYRPIYHLESMFIFIIKSMQQNA